jgi:hypothetical protein
MAGRIFPENVFRQIENLKIFCLNPGLFHRKYYGHNEPIKSPDLLPAFPFNPINLPIKQQKLVFSPI